MWVPALAMGAICRALRRKPLDREHPRCGARCLGRCVSAGPCVPPLRGPSRGDLGAFHCSTVDSAFSMSGTVNRFRHLPRALGGSGNGCRRLPSGRAEADDAAHDRHTGIHGRRRPRCGGPVADARHAMGGGDGAGAPGSTGPTVPDAGVSGGLARGTQQSRTRRAATAPQARQVRGPSAVSVSGHRCECPAPPCRTGVRWPNDPEISTAHHTRFPASRHRCPGKPSNRCPFRILWTGPTRPHRRHPGAPSFPEAFGGSTVTRDAWTDSLAFRDARSRSPPAAPVSDGTRRFFGQQARSAPRRGGCPGCPVRGCRRKPSRCRDRPPPILRGPRSRPPGAGFRSRLSPGSRCRPKAPPAVGRRAQRRASHARQCPPILCRHRRARSGLRRSRPGRNSGHCRVLHRRNTAIGAAAPHRGLDMGPGTCHMATSGFGSGR